MQGKPLHGNGFYFDLMEMIKWVGGQFNLSKWHVMCNIPIFFSYLTSTRYFFIHSKITTKLFSSVFSTVYIAFQLILSVWKVPKSNMIVIMQQWSCIACLVEVLTYMSDWEVTIIFIYYVPPPPPTGWGDALFFS